MPSVLGVVILNVNKMTLAKKENFRLWEMLLLLKLLSLILFSGSLFCKLNVKIPVRLGSYCESSHGSEQRRWIKGRLQWWEAGSAPSSPSHAAAGVMHKFFSLSLPPRPFGVLRVICAGGLLVFFSPLFPIIIITAYYFMPQGHSLRILDRWSHLILWNGYYSPLLLHREMEALWILVTCITCFSTLVWIESTSYKGSWTHVWLGRV